MTVRKNFLLDEDVAEHLVELSRKRNISQTQIVSEAINKEYMESTKEEKLEAVKSFIGSSNGLFKDMSVQSIKANMDV